MQEKRFEKRDSEEEEYDEYGNEIRHESDEDEEGDIDRSDNDGYISDPELRTA